MRPTRHTSRESSADSARPSGWHRVTVRLCAAATCLLGLLSAAPAHAGKERIAVLVVGASPREVEIADNVTEVVIARVVQGSSAEIAGTPEFRRRLGLETPRQAGSCLEDANCLGRVAVSLGVTRIVAGSVSRRDKQYLFNLALHDIPGERVLARVFRIVEGSVDDLVRSVQDATDELFVVKPDPGRVRVTSATPTARVTIDDAFVGTTPVVSGNLVPGKHTVRVEKRGHFAWASEVQVPQASTLEINLTPDSLPERKTLPSVVAYGSGGAALLALIAGTTLGLLAQREPSAANRADAQSDFEQRLRMGTAADALLASAAVLGIGSALVFWFYRDHIFETDRAHR
jgi:PEGA domain